MRRYPSGPSSGPGRKRVKSTSKRTAFSIEAEDRSTVREASRVIAGGGPCPPRGSRLRQNLRSGRAGGGNVVSPAILIGVPRFELGASPTRTERATRLRHTPSAERVPALRAPDRGVARPQRAAVCSGREGRPREAGRLTRPGSE